jgi:hypothetical protein
MASPEAIHGDHADAEGNPMNVKTEIRGDKLVLEIDISQSTLDQAPNSKSGKTRMVASTSGFTKVGPVSVSLNVTTK